MEYWILSETDMLSKFVLFPYYAVLKLRNAYFERRADKCYRAPVPVICVGNVTVGGTGKTPHTELLLRLLSGSEEWSGKRLAVLSRGYRRRSSGYLELPLDADALKYGDEPVQIKRKFPDVKVAVCKDRKEGCERLCSGDSPADLIILDDAFQYRELKADVTMVLVDYSRPVFNDELLPVGTLRDIPERIYSAGTVIVTKCPNVLYDEEKTGYAETLGYRSFNPETSEAVTPDGRRQGLYFTSVNYGELTPLFRNTDQRFVYSGSQILFSGIARDGSLHGYLCEKYKIVWKLSFPDHHFYTKKDIGALLSCVRSHPVAGLVTTEKDACRILACEGIPDVLSSRMFYIPIESGFGTREEKDRFLAALSESLKR